MNRLVARVLCCCLLLVLVAQPALATDCAQLTMLERVAQADAIVIARVVDVDGRLGLALGLLPETGAPHTLAVEHVYKGGLESRLTIYQQRTLGAPVLRAGERWLLFLHEDRFGHLTAGPCTPSTKLEPGEEVSGYVAGWLGEGWPPDAPPARAWVSAVGLTGLVLAAGGLVVLWRRRRAQMQ